VLLYVDLRPGNHQAEDEATLGDKKSRKPYRETMQLDDINPEDCLTSGHSSN
jgi:hypothetical protein